MKRKIITVLCIIMLACVLVQGCAGSAVQTETAKTEDSAEPEAETESETEPQTEPAAEPETAPKEEPSKAAVVLEDGVYTAEFDTDSSMFHVNEACDGKGILTVQDGEMTIHISLVSKNILNLYPGLAEDAAAEGAEVLAPTTDEVTYSDGITEEVYGFDVPVPALDEEFDLAIVGTKGTWYDHKVIVTNPEPAE